MLKLIILTMNFTHDAEHSGHRLPVVVQHGPVVVLWVLSVPQLGPPVHFGYQTANFQRTLAGHCRCGWTPVHGGSANPPATLVGS